MKWCNALFSAGVDLYVWSLNNPSDGDYPLELKGRISSPGIYVDANKEGSALKLSYLKYLSHLKLTIQQVKPDILHAHYATSYGLLGALSGHKPFIISVWGSDVMSFPQKSPLHKWVLRFVLTRGSQVQASGEFLRKITEQFTDKVKVVNFGLENSFFSRNPVVKTGEVPAVVIGSVKSLESHYRIDILLKAFSLVKKNLESKQKLMLVIVGDGSKKSELQNLASELEITADTEFAGKVAYASIAKYHTSMDIHVCTSERESFGVSILEAMASGVPVICSDISAFDELVTDGETGLRFRQGDSTDLATKIISLTGDSDLKESLIKKAALRAEKYKLDHCVKSQMQIYSSLLSEKV